MIKESFIDKNDKDGCFVVAQMKLKSVTLENIKKIKLHGYLSRIKQSRLSVMHIGSKS